MKSTKQNRRHLPFPLGATYSVRMSQQLYVQPLSIQPRKQLYKKCYLEEFYASQLLLRLRQKTTDCIGI